MSSWITWGSTYNEGPDSVSKVEPEVLSLRGSQAMMLLYWKSYLECRAWRSLLPVGLNTDCAGTAFGELLKHPEAYVHFLMWWNRSNSIFYQFLQWTFSAARDGSLNVVLNQQQRVHWGACEKCKSQLTFGWMMFPEKSHTENFPVKLSATLLVLNTAISVTP